MDWLERGERSEFDEVGGGNIVAPQVGQGAGEG